MGDIIFGFWVVQLVVTIFVVWPHREELSLGMGLLVIAVGSVLLVPIYVTLVVIKLAKAVE